MPMGASDESLVKTSSETISRGAFYEGFFEQLAQNLSSAKAAIDAGSTPAQNPATPATGSGSAGQTPSATPP